MEASQSVSGGGAGSMSSSRASAAFGAADESVEILP